MNYIIFKDGKEVNRIVADQAFCEQYYSKDGYSYAIIPNKPVPIDVVQTAKLSELSAACSTTITAGCDVTLTDGTTGHISLTAELPKDLAANMAAILAVAGGVGDAV